MRKWKTTSGVSALMLFGAIWSGASAQDVGASNSLVGTWRTVLPLGGNPTPVIWQTKADGTCSYRLAASRSGSIPCTWSLDGEILNETSKDGPSSRARVQWIGRDELTLTIIDNGQPKEAGSVRRYTRQ